MTRRWPSSPNSWRVKSIADYDVGGIVNITAPQAEDAVIRATGLIEVVAGRLS